MRSVHPSCVTSGSLDARVRLRAQLAVDAFLVIHAGLHFAMRHHELYTFDSWVSQLCIFGGGAVGLMHAGRSRSAEGRPVSWPSNAALR